MLALCATRALRDSWAGDLDFFRLLTFYCGMCMHVFPKVHEKSPKTVHHLADHAALHITMCGCALDTVLGTVVRFVANMFTIAANCLNRQTLSR
jgi:hypothetical protein